MEMQDLKQVRDRYEAELLHNILPFWMNNGLDDEHGGYFTGLDRFGNVIETDKSIWFQGRFGWVLGRLAQRYPERPEAERWRAACESGISFLRESGTGDEGRFLFRVTREGKPLVMRRYLFSDLFAAMAEAAWAPLGGGESSLRRAAEILKRVAASWRDGSGPEPKFDPAVRPGSGLSMPMMLINTAQEIRDIHREISRNGRDLGTDLLLDVESIIEEALDVILGKQMHPEYRCVLEQVGPDGAFLDHFEGRLVNPGHNIELSWFLLREAAEGGRSGLDMDQVDRIKTDGLRILDWMLADSWDEEYGGFYYFRDALDHPSTEYWHDMKFWWPHAEALIATAYALLTTKDDRYLHWFDKIDRWSYDHFADREHGEWFGYLRRDGSVSSTIKGNIFKGPFHIPRMLMICVDLLDRILSST